MEHSAESVMNTETTTNTDVQKMSLKPDNAGPPSNLDDSYVSGNRYLKTQKLGEGTYGVVYKAIDHLKNVEVALKKIRMDAWEEGVPAIALREVAVLKQIRSPYLVNLDDVFFSHTGNLYLVLELMDWDLKQYMDPRRKNGADALFIKSVIYQMLAGADECHKNRVFHRDLKPQNVLLNRIGSVKLADLGLARLFALPNRPYTHEVVTLWYRAPEILLGSKIYNAKIDSWSIGCMMAEMFNGRPPFTGDSEIDQIFQIFRTLGTPNEHHWVEGTGLPYFSKDMPQWPAMQWSKFVPRLHFDADWNPNVDTAGVDLLEKLLNYDPEHRMSCAEALKHPWFDDLNHEDPTEDALASGCTPLNINEQLPTHIHDPEFSRTIANARHQRTTRLQTLRNPIVTHAMASPFPSKAMQS